ncbi:hypothetical protein [Arcticibacter sp. MXS-1]|uniref:hypothetical protein n=1 Tax=Arcticibacter sp. MXS-1 TaxID=3341726 RepID=UPI0035A8491C
MRRANKSLSMGMLLVALSLTLKHFFVQLPDFLMGLLLGSGIGLELLGIYAMKHDLTPVRNFKKKIFNKIIGKGA